MKLRLALGSALLLTATTAALVIACSDNSQGAIIVAFDTDVKVPDNVNQLGISIKVDNQVRYTNLFVVDANHHAALPSTLAIEEGDKKNPVVTIRAVAFLNGKARIVRDVTATVPHAHVSAFRMTLSYLALDVNNPNSVDNSKFAAAVGTASAHGIHLGNVRLQDDVFDSTGGTVDLFATISDTKCLLGADQTNVDGTCVDVHVDSATFPDYVPEDYFGDAGDAGQTCFDVENCFTGALGVTLDRQSCTFPLGALTPDMFNVGLVTKNNIGWCESGAGDCYVPLSANDPHGFTIDPPSTSPRLVHLPPGACTNPDRVAQVVVTSKCAPKPITEPIDGAGVVCLPDGNDASTVTDASSDASSDAISTDANANMPTTEISGATGVFTSVAVLNGDVFAVGDSTLAWHPSGMTKEYAFPILPREAGTAKNPVVSVDSKVIGIVFPDQAYALVMPFDVTKPSQSYSPFEISATVFSPVASFGLSGSIYFGADDAQGANEYQVAASLTPGTQPAYCGMVLATSGPNVMAFALDPSGKNLYGVTYDTTNGQAAVYPISLPDPCKPLAPATLTKTPISTRPLNAVYVPDPNNGSPRIAFSATTGGAVSIFAQPIDGKPEDVLQLVDDTGALSDDPARPIAADKNGYVYYTGNSGQLLHVSAFGGEHLAGVAIPQAPNARGIATDATKLYFTSPGNGVLSIKLPTNP